MSVLQHQFLNACVDKKQVYCKKQWDFIATCTLVSVIINNSLWLQLLLSRNWRTSKTRERNSVRDCGTKQLWSAGKGTLTQYSPHLYVGCICQICTICRWPYALCGSADCTVQSADVQTVFWCFCLVVILSAKQSADGYEIFRSKGCAVESADCTGTTNAPNIYTSL